MLNEVNLLGRVGGDPEIRYTPAGVGIANLSLATSEKYKKDGEVHEITEWHRLVMFGVNAENAGKYIKKGDLIFIKGKLKTDEYTDKEGIKRYATKIHVNLFKMLGNKNNNSGTAQTQNNTTTDELDDDIIPF
jgi:single-strand DNA-binding protein